MAILYVYGITTCNKRSLFDNMEIYLITNMVAMGDVVGERKRLFL